ncbi:hypothetical protein LTR56_026764 [Elasticomyces elasticus]|nr:hypothetical protein LTR56_026764 [Elasticomyces elasticus]KAK4905026.1 hypothetical protein LTR49_025624 [Elasticomyces elasticus]KAK5736284.1 hypothetical protein LTS12_026235 [Elasticomyces elasticus]
MRRISRLRHWLEQEGEDGKPEDKNAEVLAKQAGEGGELVSEKTTATGEFDDAKSQMEKIDSDDAAKKGEKKAEESKA